MQLSQVRKPEHPQFEYVVAPQCNGPEGGCGCIEVATNMVDLTGLVSLRDSKTGTTTVYTTHEWQGFLDGVKAGEFDI